jgi:hypothetical protein
MYTTEPPNADPRHEVSATSRSNLSHYVGSHDLDFTSSLISILPVEEPRECRMGMLYGPDRVFTGMQEAQDPGFALQSISTDFLQWTVRQLRLLIQYLRPVAATLEELDITIPTSNFYNSWYHFSNLLSVISLIHLTKLKHLTVYQDALFVSGTAFMTSLPPNLEHLRIKRPTEEVLIAFHQKLKRDARHFGQLTRMTLYYEAETELPDPPTLYDSEERQAIVDFSIRVSLRWNKRDYVKDWFDAKAVRRVQELDLSIG